MQAEQAEIDLARLGDFAVQGRNTHLVHQLRRHVGSHRNRAMRAQQHQRQRAGIVAAVHRKILRRALQQVAAALDIAGRVLDADDVGNLRQTQHGVVAHIRTGASRHVVQDMRHIHRFGDGLEMQVQAFLRRLVVVRHHGQRSVCTCLLREGSQLNGFFG